MGKREGRQFRISKLHVPRDFMYWRLIAKFSIEADDYQPLELNQRSESASATNLRKWEEDNEKAKSKIVSALETEPLARLNLLIEKRSAKSLWQKLKSPKR